MAKHYRQKRNILITVDAHFGKGLNRVGRRDEEIEEIVRRVLDERDRHDGRKARTRRPQ